MTKLLAEEVANWPGFGERYSKKFREMSGKMQELVTEGAKRDGGRFNVLTHDDLWTNNLLFKSPDSVRIIDFQMPHFASPGNDLQMLLTMSVTDDVRRNHFDTLMKVSYNYYIIFVVVSNNWDFGFYTIFYLSSE